MQIQKIINEILKAFGYFLLAAFFIIYIIFYEKFKNLTNFIRFIGPLVIIIGCFIIVFSRDREKIARRREKDELEQTLYITAIDELKHDLVAFATTLLMILIPFMINKKVDTPDIIQAAVTFGSIYLVKKIYFKKIGY